MNIEKAKHHSFFCLSWVGQSNKFFQNFFFIFNQRGIQFWFQQGYSSFVEYPVSLDVKIYRVDKIHVSSNNFENVVCHLKKFVRNRLDVIHVPPM